MKNSRTEKSLLNVDLAIDNSFSISSVESLEIFSLSENDLCLYLETIFQTSGDLYISLSGEYIITFKIQNLEESKNIQRALQKLKIQSTLVKQSKSNEYNIILVTQKTSLEIFKERITSEIMNGSEVINPFIFKVDWED